MVSDTADSGWRRGDPIGYIQEQTPEVPMPTYPGQRNDDTVPDTLDLAERAALGLNGLTNPTDPDADYEIYWRAAFNTNPPLMWHSESDIVQAKFMEALPLMRIVSGSGQSGEVERRWMEVMLQAQGPDGIVYLPKKGTVARAMACGRSTMSGRTSSRAPTVT